MSEWISDLARRLVVGRKRDGRSIYDARAKRELVLACREPGVSIAKLARDCGINANQVISWVRLYERELARGAAPSAGVVAQAKTPAFVALDIAAARQEEASSSMHVQARLPNGVVVDLRGCDMQQVLAMIEALGGLGCSDSTKG
ncbi:transposase [Variovorax sp. J22R133]|uniref:IS66-like element accessory protein TnpA n=1 Tax=Variovorax brevis TaxID=3053503 RepID=UPI002576283D|nr:transposase [Variovorax sp. J22R133]MDM0118079.1 transposase [Variovorax sp. J22R133]MDM0118081.1 transposase [Variovorax sp. J22R133]